jgi:hypothetical protein
MADSDATDDDVVMEEVQLRFDVRQWGGTAFPGL